jgi:predicted DsbA family dithiol-disulfide isomerase
MIKPALTATVFSDYICPFCYIGHLRLERLREDFDLQVDWRFLEIHPDNPPEGRPVAELGYPAHHWETLMQNLARMAEEEGVALPRREFTTNSRRALKLAEAAKEEGPEVFRRLNARLYEAYFLEQRNIGDPGVLRDLAEQSALTPERVDAAWSEPRYDDILRQNLQDAARLGINGTPAFVIGGRLVTGAVPLATLRQLACSEN